MTQYAYKAMKPSGQLITGIQEAVNEDELEQLLKKSSMDLISAKQRKQRRFSGSGGKVSRRDLITLYIDLEQMALAEIPITEALAELRDSLEPSRIQEVSAGLVRHIEQGLTLSKAMGRFPDVFDEMSVNLVAAGEAAGELPKVFNELKETITWQDNLIRQTKKLLTYPLFVGLIVFAVVCFLMIYLVPQLISFIVSMGQDIPIHTRVLIAVSDFFVEYWFLVLIAPPLLFYLTHATLQKSTDARRWYDRHKLEIPLVGVTIKKILLARFSRNFAMLYDAGVNLLECLRISQETVTNLYLKDELGTIKTQVEEGSSLHQAFAASTLFPPLVLRMVNVGEQTGNLGKAIMNISTFYNNDVTDGIERIQALIEPTMTVIMGLLLGWIMVSVLGPIYDLVANIQM